MQVYKKNGGTIAVSLSRTLGHIALIHNEKKMSINYELYFHLKIIKSVPFTEELSLHINKV